MRPTELIDIKNNILVKMELHNISGSHKFRAANYIIEDGINKGLIDKNTTVIEKTGGNFGFGLLAACLNKNIPVDLAIGLSFSQKKKETLKKLGANLIGLDMLNSGKSPKEVVEWHIENQDQLGKKYFYTNQFVNEGSYKAHLATGTEIASQLKMDFPNIRNLIFVACAGTGASFMGISDSLKKQGYNINAILVEPEGCLSSKNVFVDHSLEGMCVGVTPPFIKWDMVSEVCHVCDSDINIIKKQVFKDYGVLIGNTSAACYKIALQKASLCDEQTKVITLFYDSGVWYN